MKKKRQIVLFIFVGVIKIMEIIIFRKIKDKTNIEEISENENTNLYFVHKKITYLLLFLNNKNKKLDGEYLTNSANNRYFAIIFTKSVEFRAKTANCFNNNQMANLQSNLIILMSNNKFEKNQKIGEGRIPSKLLGVKKFYIREPYYLIISKERFEENLSRYRNKIK